MLDDIKKSMGTDGQSRGLAKKVIAFIAFGAIILVFVFLGIGTEQLGVSGGGVVGQVNNVTISLADYRNQVERMERQFGGSNPAFSSFIRSQALESLINQELFFQKSQDVGIIVSDDEIRDFIFNYPVFQENGRFQPSRYEAVLRANRLSVGQFEKSIRKEAATDRLRRVISMSLQPSQGEIQLREVGQNKKTKLEFLSFTEKSIAEKMVSKVTAPSEVDAELKKKATDFFKANQAEYSVQERVKARHILIKSEKRSDSEAKKKIDEIVKELNTENFATMAKKHSEDAGSGAKGGDLGFFTRGRMVKPFEDKAFSMKPGTISEPVKSQFGYHVIFVEQKQEASTKKFEEVENEIVKRVLAEEKAKEIVSSIEQKVKAKDVSAIESFKSEQGLEWSKTSEFSLSSDSVPTIGRSDELIEKAFQLGDKELAEKIFRISGRSYIIRGEKVSSHSGSQSETKQDVAKASDEMAQVQANDALTRLQEQWRDQAHIERNERYLEASN